MKLATTFVIIFYYFISVKIIDYQFLIQDFETLFSDIQFNKFWISIFLSTFVTAVEFVFFYISKYRPEISNSKFETLTRYSIIHISSLSIISIAFRIVGQSRRDLILLFFVLIVSSLLIEIIEKYQNFKFFSIASIVIYVSIVSNSYVPMTSVKTVPQNNEIKYKECDEILNLNGNYNSSTSKVLGRYLIVGHSYGNPSGENIALQESLLNFFKVSDLEDAKLILTGDLIRKYSQDNLLEAREQIESYFDEYYVVPGNHDVQFGNAFYEVFKNDFFSFEVGNSLLIGANFNSPNWLPTIYTQNLINDIIKNSDKNNIFLFSHQVFWFDEFPDFQLANSYALYEGSNQDSISWINFNDKNLIIISGDSGAWGQELFCKQNLDRTITYIASGLGNAITDSILELSFHDDYTFILNKILIND
jgi:hypothetical protein